MNCKKCNLPAPIILRKKDHYCCNCFLTNTNHKFRACIGKNKILSCNEKVLLCLSGGLGSSVLLDLVHNGICLDNHKKLRILPHILHLIGVADNDTIAKSVIKQCEKHNLNVYLVHISEYIQTNSQLPDGNKIPQVDSITDKQFQAMLKTMPSSARTDFLSKVKRSLFVRYAEVLQCNYIFTAETTTTLAINLLSNLALGRGAQVQNDVGFSDNRDEKIRILRPMKDITKKELHYYINIKQLDYVDHSDVQSNSLQSAISSFVTDLQENFQSTISTVCKTADKIGTDSNIHEKCIICENGINTKSRKFSALEATNFSRTVSYGKSEFKESNASTTSLAHLDCPQGELNKSMFPFVNKYLCYACSRNHSESNRCILPLRLQKLLE